LPPTFAALRTSSVTHPGRQLYYSTKPAAAFVLGITQKTWSRVAHRRCAAGAPPCAATRCPQKMRLAATPRSGVTASMQRPAPMHPAVISVNRHDEWSLLQILSAKASRCNNVLAAPSSSASCMALCRVDVNSALWSYLCSVAWDAAAPCCGPPRSGAAWRLYTPLVNRGLKPTRTSEVDWVDGPKGLAEARQCHRQTTRWSREAQTRARCPATAVSTVGSRLTIQHP